MMVVRNEVAFLWEARLKKVVREFGPQISGPFGFDLARFEREYRSSSNDLALKESYDFKVLKNTRVEDQHGTYHLCQVHLEPRKQYRMVMLRSDELSSIWYLWAFKKQKMFDPDQIAVAKRRARDELWPALWRSR